MTRRITKNFTSRELASRDGNPVPAAYYDNAKEICQRAQRLRDLVGPLIVRSGYRTASHNERVGGAPRSKHLTASALDLHSREFDAEQLALIYRNLVRLGHVPAGGLGVYPRDDGGWIHIDLGRDRQWIG